MNPTELDFMSRLLDTDPSARMTGAQCLQHPYLAGARRRPVRWALGGGWRGGREGEVRGLIAGVDGRRAGLYAHTHTHTHTHTPW